MSTQANALTGKAAEVLAAIGAQTDKKISDALAAAKFATGDQLEGLKTFVAEQMEKNLQAIIDAKKAPGFAQTTNKWNVRNPRTGEVRAMQYSLGKIFHCLMGMKRGIGLPTEAAFAAEAEYVKRTITEGTSGAGGTLIPQEWTDFVIPELGAAVVVMKAGPNVLPMQHQIMNIPGLTSNASYSWLGEDASISESAPATNNTPLTLHTLKGLTGISVEWLRDATPETDAALQANLVRGASRAVDLGYLNGSGSSNQPTGFLNVSGINQIYAGLGAANGSTIIYDDFSQAIYQLDNNNAPSAGRCWFMNPRTMAEVRQIKDTLGRPIFIDSVSNQNLSTPSDPNSLFRGANGMILGYPVYTSTQIPTNLSRGTANTCSAVLFVAMSDIYVGQGIKSQGLEVAISEEALFTSAEIAVRLLYRTDIQPGHVVSICSIGGVL